MGEWRFGSFLSCWRFRAGPWREHEPAPPPPDSHDLLEQDLVPPRPWPFELRSLNKALEGPAWGSWIWVPTETRMLPSLPLRVSPDTGHSRPYTLFQAPLGPSTFLLLKALGQPGPGKVRCVKVSLWGLRRAAGQGGTWGRHRRTWSPCLAELPSLPLLHPLPAGSPVSSGAMSTPLSRLIWPR